MTISYAGEVPNGSSFGCFWRILWKWRGSVYKLVWRELLAYLALYYSINFMYRYALNEDQKRFVRHLQQYFDGNIRIFEKMRLYFGAQSESIPMSFVLGFYVSLIVKRWWEQYKLLPWPDTLALFISAAIPGNDERGRLMRRNIMRYSVLAYVITLMRISLRVKRRFPTHQHLVDAGLMLDSEKKIFEIMDGKSPMSKYWMPLVWATNIINRARKEKIIESDQLVQTLLGELSDIRRRLGALIGYDTVCVPLVYTQVVTLVLYTYFIAALLGRQMIPHDTQTGGGAGKYEDPDLYFPLFTALQFCFYVGWLKVAEVLINPFGEDDDDIELNWLIDRHIKASYMIVDEMHNEHPELLKDQYWNQVVPDELPYTVASEHYRKFEPKGSAENYKVKTTDAMYANIAVQSKRHQSDDVYADYESVDTPMPERRRNWLSRQITRIGSIRSSSTAYSSGGLYKAGNRKNSVYSSPEPVLTTAGGQPIPINSHKMSFSKKARQLIKQNSRSNLNGQISSVVLKTRPRIPTPDVTKEGMEKENRFNLTPVSPSLSQTINMNMAGSSTSGLGGGGGGSSGISGTMVVTPSVAAGVALAARKLATEPSVYPTTTLLNEGNIHHAVATLQLSPIKELDSGSVNNTLQAGSPSTIELAKAILPLSLQTVGQSLAKANAAGMLNSPISTRIKTPHEVSVAITTLPVTTHQSINEVTTFTSPSQNVNIIDLSVNNLVDELNNQTKHLTPTTSSSTTTLSRRNSTISSSNRELNVRVLDKTDLSVSAPSTLINTKPGAKSGEVYV